MGKYLIEYTQSAIEDLRKHKKSGNTVNLNKIQRLISELKSHPYSGTGKPEQLKHDLHDFWSRRINQKDRLVYHVKENVITVIVISAMGHYKDK